MTTEITRVETSKELLIQLDTLHKQIYALKSMTEKLECTDAEDYTRLAKELSEIKALNKSLTDTEKALIAPFKNVVKNVQENNREFFDIVELAERNIKTTMLVYNDNQERIKRAEEARIALEEAERIAREKAKLEKKIEKAEEKGNMEKAESLQEQKDNLVPIVAEVKVNTPKVESINYAIRYDFEITDANLIPREYLMPDEKKIKRIVVAMKELASIPGVKVIMIKDIRSK